MRQGQPIVQTRLEWLALTRSNRLAEKRRTRAGELKGRAGRLSMCEALPPIFVVQLLGAVDDLVSPDDAVRSAAVLRLTPNPLRMFVENRL
jgi:hypothetical protein